MKTAAPFLAALLLALLSPSAAAQSLGANAREDRFSGPVAISIAWWHSQIEDRGSFGAGTANSDGPVINGRVDLADRWSSGITFAALGGEIRGTLVDPYVEFWLTPPAEENDFYVGAYLGYHWGDFEYRGPHPQFTFADGRVGEFRDNGFFAGIEGWLPLDERWTVKGSLSWYPARQDAEFFDTTEMHPLYTLGAGYRFTENFSLSLVGAISPIARDGLLVLGVTWAF